MTENNTSRRALRNALLSDGYTPLPLLSDGKGLYIKGWSRAEVTKDWLKQYARSANYGNTGLRCDTLAAFDIDVLDPELADDAEKNIEDVCGSTELCRFGRAPKRLLLYRMKGKPPFRSMRTPRYEGGHQVELLCGNGRQFAAFGMHPSGVPYEWDGPSPLDVPLAKLPAVTYEQATETIELLESYFDSLGLAHESPGLAFGAGGQQEFDLTDDFECQVDGEIIHWGDLKGQLTTEGVFGNIRRENGEFGDSSAVHFMLAQGSGEPCIHDFVRDSTHWDNPVNPELANVLPDLAGGDMFEPDFIGELRDNHVLLADNTVRKINDPLHPYVYSHFKLRHANWKLDVGTAQKPKLISAVDAWKEARDTLRADKAELRPDYPDQTIVETDGIKILNTYCPPVHPEGGGEIDTVLEFLEHLIPNASERELFIDWHALKVHQPSLRMHGMLMVTPEFGTGRGTWIQICQRLFGMQYVNEVPLRRLIGTGGQSEFNEYMANSLIVAVPEALEERTEDEHKWRSRHIAYEQLKLICEPIAQRIHVARKYGKNTVEWCHASLLISTNHIDALAIEPGDRRLIVIENCETPLAERGDLQDRIHAWKDKPENIGALHRELLARATFGVQYDPLAPPVETAAKSRMVESGVSDGERAFELFAETAPGAIATHAQFLRWINANRVAFELDLPDDYRKLNNMLTAVLKKRARRIPHLKNGIKLRGEKGPVRPWVIREFKKWCGNTNNARIAAEILQNGPPTNVTALK